MKTYKICIVGGNIDEGKPSGVVKKLGESLSQFGIVEIHNGKLPNNIKGNDIVIWMPDISNDYEKIYPVKDKGTVLICSKVLRENRTEIDAVSRIFDMHGNAVIAIDKSNKDLLKFKLIDALGNTWTKTNDIDTLTKYILDLHLWSSSQIRVSLKQKELNFKEIPKLEQRFIDANTLLANKIQAKLGARYFGNFCTRCTKLFPCTRVGEDMFMFSPRNTDKSRLQPDDFVLVDSKNYYGNRKPSVDTPAQLKILNRYPDINYMVHGHAYIVNVPSTIHYYPCGDLREVEGVFDVFDEGCRLVNLKNHGFLIATHNLSLLLATIQVLKFKQKDILV